MLNSCYVSQKNILLLKHLKPHSKRILNFFYMDVMQHAHLKWQVNYTPRVCELHFIGDLHEKKQEEPAAVLLFAYLTRL